MNFTITYYYYYDDDDESKVYDYDEIIYDIYDNIPSGITKMNIIYLLWRGGGGAIGEKKRVWVLLQLLYDAKYNTNFY